MFSRNQSFMIKPNITLFLFVLLISSNAFSQELEYHILPDEINEASGIERLNDSTYILINDGGNEAIIYLVNKNGKLIKRVSVAGSKNRDWEDLTRDRDFLYIGDFGNNKNLRKDLCILKIKISDIETKTEIIPEKIYFKYNDQNQFPPEKKDFNFDAEAMFTRNDSIIILTKSNSEPWNGKTTFYTVPKKPGIYSLKKDRQLHIGDNGWAIDAITAADFYHNKLYILTYNRILIFNCAENELKLKKSYSFNSYTQKEGLLILNSKEVMVVDEKSSLLGGGKLYKYKIK